ARDHVPRQAELAVTRGAQRIELPPAAADENVRARHVRAPGEIEADEGDLARAVRDAAGLLQLDEIARELGVRLTRVREEPEDSARQHGRGPGDETLRNQLAARHRADRKSTRLNSSHVKI